MRRVLPLNAKPIKKYRIAKDITVAELAKYLKSSRQTIYNYEAGTQLPPPKQLEKIADLLEVKKLDLLAEEGD